MKSGKNIILGMMLLLLGKCASVPVESTTTKILMPDDEDDAIIIDLESDSNSTSTSDSTPEEFNAVDCLLPPAKGPCRAVIEQYFYNKKTKKCESFDWSGCGGNLNRFAEKQFCEQHCGSGGTVEAEVKAVETCPKFDGCGPLKCGISKDPTTGCEKCDCNLGNDAEKKEKKVIIGSVSGNPEIPTPQEIPATKLKPEEVCPLPESRGNCRAMITRWRYNPEIKECVQFHFGGCDGNPNNFVSKEKCAEFCRGQ